MDWTEISAELLQRAKDNRVPMKYTVADVAKVVKAAYEDGAVIRSVTMSGEEHVAGFPVWFMGAPYWIDQDWQPPKSKYEEYGIIYIEGCYTTEGDHDVRSGLWVNQLTATKGYIGMRIEKPDGTMDNRIFRRVPLYCKRDLAWMRTGETADEHDQLGELEPGIPKVALFVKGES